MKRTFISFDFDHDRDLKDLLVGQSRNEDTPFEIADWSVKEELSGDWKEKVRSKMKSVDLVIVICGEHTNTATGVNAELNMATQLEKPYFLLWGRNNKTCRKPKAAKSSDKVYKWTWDNLKKLIKGNR